MMVNKTLHLPPTTPELAAAVRAYCRKHKVAETSFGRVVCNDLALMTRLSRPGYNPSLSRVREIITALGMPPSKLEQRAPVKGAADVDDLL